MYDVLVKGCFHLNVLRFLNDGVEMLRKIVMKLFMQVIWCHWFRHLTLDNMVKEL